MAVSWAWYGTLFQRRSTEIYTMGWDYFSRSIETKYFAKIKTLQFWNKMLDLDLDNAGSWEYEYSCRNYFTPLCTSSSVHWWWIRTLLDDLISLCVKLFRLLWNDEKKSEMYGQAGHNIQVLTTFQDDKFFILWKKYMHTLRFAKT